MKTFILIVALLGVVSCGKKPSSSSSSPNDERREDEVVAGLEHFEEEYIKLVNNYRSSIGLRNLKYVKVIEEVAAEHSSYMSHGIGRFGHRGWRTRCNKLMNELQGRACGEIVAMGQKSPQDVLYAWIKSPSHRKALENPDMTHTGLGVAQNQKGIIFWTQIFIDKR